MSNASDEGKIRLVCHSEAFWRVTFDLPPLNIFGPANIPQLEEVVSSLESDDRVKVVVLIARLMDFFLRTMTFWQRPRSLPNSLWGRPGCRPYLTCL
jgi:hypothetical protein